MAEIEAVILASGLSQRMGRDKLLLPLGNRTVIYQFLSHFPFSLFTTVIIVWSNMQVFEIARQFPALLCQNDSPQLGKAHAIQLGLNAGNSQSPVLFTVADQPLLTADTIGRLVELYQRNPEKIVRPYINNSPANPVIFPADLRSELQFLTGDSGGRELINSYPERVHFLSCSAAEEFYDIDTPKDYQQLIKRWKREN